MRVFVRARTCVSMYVYATMDVYMYAWPRSRAENSMWKQSK